MRAPNPIKAEFLSAAERRAELCAILALGLVRLHLPEKGQLPDDAGEIPLHSSPDQCRHATATPRRDA